MANETLKDLYDEFVLGKPPLCTDNPTLPGIIDAYRGRSTWLLKNKKQAIPPTPPGNESFKHEIGDTVLSKAYSPPKPTKITDRWIENGFCRYLCDNGMVHRTIDIAE